MTIRKLRDALDNLMAKHAEAEVLIPAGMDWQKLENFGEIRYPHQNSTKYPYYFPKKGSTDLPPALFLGLETE
jgi:hypothetical protein